MENLIIFCMIFYVIYYIRYRKYINPYRLIMVFGKKGSGKSSFLVKQAVKYQKKKWLVYTNMEELNIPGIRHFKIDDLGKFVPEKNSVLLIDEAGREYDNRNFKNFRSEQRDFYKYQRHYKVIVYLASQTYDIDKKLRDLVDDMILVQNVGIVYSLLRPIRKSVTLTEATGESESRIAENLKFRTIFSWRMFKITKYSRYFDSFVVPEKSELPYYCSDNKNVEQNQYDYKKHIERGIGTLFKESQTPDYIKKLILKLQAKNDKIRKKERREESDSSGSTTIRHISRDRKPDKGYKEQTGKRTTDVNDDTGNEDFLDGII